jgi:hypothetical protein
MKNKTVKNSDESMYKKLEFNKKTAQSARKLLKSKKKPTSVSKDRVIRFDDEIDPLVDLFIEKYNITFDHLMNLAVIEFMSKPHKIEIVPIDPDEWNQLMKKAYEKHRHAMDKLKD